MFRILGRFEVVRDGQPLPETALGSRKQRRLLKLLVLERRHIVPTDRIVERLWASPPPRGSRLIATLVSRLRATLRRDIIQGGPDGYLFAPGRLATVDLDEAEDLVAQADRRLRAGEPSLARISADAAMSLLERGAVLEDEPYAEWVEAPRAAAERLLRDARSLAWRAALAMNDPEAAIAAAERAIAADRLDEEAHRALMLGHQAAGRRAEALATYERLRDGLSLELGVEPAVETRDLWLEIAAGERRTVGPERLAASAAPPAREPPEPLDPTFVGREGEIGAAIEAWKAAAAGRTSLVLLVGEAGIGKTTVGSRLVTLVRSTGGLVLESRCYEAERSLFLQPIADALRPLVLRSNGSTLRALMPDGGAGLARVMPELPVAIGTPIPEPTIPELERRRAFEAAADLIRSLAGRQPVLLYVDDLHLAGAASVEFLHFLVRRAAPSRLLVLGTVRVEEGEEVRRALGDVARVVEVGPLPADGVRRLAATMGAPQIDEQFLERTRGHPLFVVEMLRALAERPAPSTGSHAPIPETLRAAVLERVERAGRDVADLLAAAAVLGARFDLELVAKLTDLSIEEAIGRAGRAHRARLLIHAGTDFAFSNDLTHEIVYAATPLPVRTLRHGRAAALLAGRPELVGRHAYAAGRWAEAAEAWLEAAREATSHYANVDAEALLDRALEASGRAAATALEARIKLARGRVLEALGKYGAAVRDAAAAVEIARRSGDRRLEMEGLRDMGGDPLVALGRTPADCIPYLEAALVIANELDDRGFSIDILRRLAVIETNNLRGQAARRYAETALRSAGDTGDELARAAALDASKTVAAYIGDVDRLEELVAELRPILERRDRPWFLQWAVFESSFVPLARGQWEHALERIGEALDLNRRTGYHAYQAMFLAQRAWIESAAGRYGQALGTAEAAAAIAADVGHPWWIAFAASVHGRVLCQLGAFDLAVPILEGGLDVADRDGTQMYVLRCLGPLAEASVGAGDRARGRALAERAARLSPPIAPRPLFLHPSDGPLSAARAWLALDEPDRAVPILDEIARAAEASGWLEPLAAATLALGWAHHARGEADAASAAWLRAIDVASDLLPGLSADAHAALARAAADPLQANDGDGPDVTNGVDGHAATARRLYESLAASLSDARLRARFEALAADRLGESTAPLPAR